MLMFRLLSTLILVRLRKFLPKNDRSAIALFLLFLGGCYTVFFRYFDDIGFLGLVLFLDPLFYHLKRHDLELLKESKKYRLLLFSEYLTYTLPVIFIYLFKGEFYVLFGVLYAYFITFVKQIKVNPLPLPFKIIAPIWHIYFRKYRGYLIMIISIFLLCMGGYNDNENLIHFAVILSLLFPIAIYFEEDRSEFIVYSKYVGRHFLNKQLFVYFINVFLFNALFVIIHTVFVRNLDQSLLLISVYLYSSVVVICKYYTNNLLFRGMLFGLLVGGVPYGAFVLIPYLYLRGVKNIEKLQC